ncbi:hypothetical protein PMAYCL1PPCAC_24656, partial [Pristionchus mayeri]
MRTKCKQNCSFNILHKSRAARCDPNWLKHSEIFEIFQLEVDVETFAAFDVLPNASLLDFMMESVVDVGSDIIDFVNAFFIIVVIVDLVGIRVVLIVEVEDGHEGVDANHDEHDSCIGEELDCQIIEEVEGGDEDDDGVSDGSRQQPQGLHQRLHRGASLKVGEFDARDGEENLS